MLLTMAKVTSIYLTPAVNQLIEIARKLGISGSPAHRLQQLAILGQTRLTGGLSSEAAIAQANLRSILPQLRVGLEQARQQAQVLTTLVARLTEGIAAAEQEEARLGESLQALIAITNLPPTTVGLADPQGH